MLICSLGLFNPWTRLPLLRHVTWKCGFPVLSHQETHSNLSESQKKGKKEAEDLVCVTESSGALKFFFVAPGGASGRPFFCIGTALQIAARNLTSRCARAEVVSWAVHRRGRQCVPVRNAVGRDERCLRRKSWHAPPCLANSPELPRCSKSFYKCSL